MASAQLHLPDGIDHEHAEKTTGANRHANAVPILILGAMVLATSLGAFGGSAPPLDSVADGPQLSVTAPRTLRSGMFFETRAEITARTDVADLVVAVPQDLWRDMTINTMLPAASEETFKQRSFQFSYGPLKRGETIALKIDGQIDPSPAEGTIGKVAVLDGDRPIGAIPIDMHVLP